MRPGAALGIALALLAARPAGAGTPPPAWPMPCVAEVCVDDELDDLLDRPWLRVELPDDRPVATRGRRRLARALHGEPQDVDTVLTHWPYRWFDAPALHALDALDAVCENLGVWWRPHAALPGPGGTEVVVAFEPIASAGDHQRFRVATISLRFPAGADDPALLTLRDALSRQYAQYPVYPTDDEPGVRWLKEADGDLSLKLFSPIEETRAHDAQLRAQPACAH